MSTTANPNPPQAAQAKNEPVDLRLDYLNPEWLRLQRRLASECVVRGRSLVERNRNTLGSRHFIWLSAYSHELGLIDYASGAPLTHVQNHFAEGARAYARMLEFSAKRRDAERDSGRPHKPIKEVLDSETGKMKVVSDYSITNSNKTLKHVLGALVANDAVLARTLASGIWDPKEAFYVRENSEICSTDQQVLAYALREAVAGDHVGAQRERHGFTGGNPYLERVNSALGALVSQAPDRFLTELNGLNIFHAEFAQINQNKKTHHLFLSLHALGLARLALYDELVSVDALPDSVYFPKSIL